ncbi:alanyl-tRNA editing protein [Candidatus Woesearchaeota archaeon]|jgi:misacylated tRNA(Ala) deacylase|nr:alanyl-tRNA editing protein [Candidatus Woesearchaeota archaeon]MBT5271713.1 alanyl-tRNA editing protein [Candidatus Woesearchaeota archaeon]MBT6041097.1 alanyl-tRNA editing protein [Candidatus Woesearchaeota archaeon]MBT6337422.1 alanyl-tRNA editing protein [Candidatus Woesearchaeota archaeon]MBT7926917.1 alanyl-tRNA editing protein [Candidatus Woesearchaeota archaeon]
MTETLYLDDSYLKEWEAKVVSVKDSGKGTLFVTLDKSAFYPNSGGQPHDEGVMIRKSDNKEFNVIFVGKFSGEVSHEINCGENESLKPEDIVECKLNWERRYKLMKMHTACHILAGVLHKECKAMITGNQLNIEKSRIDFSVEEYNPEMMANYIAESNKIAAEGHENKVYYVDKNEDVDKFMRLAKGLPENITNVRIVEIVGFDIQPDGGTHVKNTKEVGNLKFLKSENKGKNNRRLYFELE